jgi:hypothetical protein
MLSENLLTAEQQNAIDYIYERDASILVAPTGEGKSVICLTAIAARVVDMPHCQTLIVCPPKVVPVHKKEAAKWDHLSHLKIVELVGDPSTRGHILLSNADADADVYVISLNNLDWLLDNNLLPDTVNGVIIDELSKAAGKQTRKLRHKKWLNQITWRVGMTATPVSHDFKKVFNMTRCVAGPDVFGNNETRFLQQYFYPDWNGHSWTIRDGAAEQIMAKLKPYVHLIEDRKASKLPALTERLARFDMPALTRAHFIEMAAEMLVGGVEAANEAVQSGKLRQIGSGFIYNSEETVRFDFARQAAFLREIDSDLPPVLVFYEFEAQKAEIKWAGESVAFSMAEFDPKEHKVLAVQINSLSHGVDGLQHQFHRVLFYQPVWSRDAYHQARDRVWRQGQRHPVDVATLVCNDTLDDLVLTRVEERGRWMDIFTENLK